MKTFILRARKGTTRWDRVRSQLGGKEHFEVIAHSILNAFFVSKDFRKDVEFYIVLDSSDDFPRTIRLASNEGLSIEGFHEDAILNLIENVLKDSHELKKDETQQMGAGVQISGFGFEKLMSDLIKSRPVYFLDPKGENIRTVALKTDPVFVLSDHIPMPANIVKSFKRRGLEFISLGRKMLFASQCITVIHYELDNQASTAVSPRQSTPTINS